MCSRSVYETRPGDTPMVIAKEQLGDRDLWADIVVWNADKCGFMGPNDWYRNGTILRLPEVAAMSAIDEISMKFEKHHEACSLMIDRDKWLAVVSEIEALRQERDELRADAVRYRWLRHGDNDELVFVQGTAWLARNEDLDAAIDTAMAKEQGDGN